MPKIILLACDLNIYFTSRQSRYAIYQQKIGRLLTYSSCKKIYRDRNSNINHVISNGLQMAAEVGASQDC